MSVTIQRGLPDDARPAAAALYWAAFGGKLGRVLGPDPRGLCYVERVLDDTHVLSAMRGDELLGVIGFRSPRSGFVGGTPQDLTAIYGRLGGLWRRACFGLLARDIETRAFVIDGISVREDCRGQGIGAALIEALCAEAQKRGYGFVRLDVVAQNAAARRLYERLGFRVARHRKSLATQLAFTFRHVVVMERAL